MSAVDLKPIDELEDFVEEVKIPHVKIAIIFGKFISKLVSERDLKILGTSSFAMSKSFWMKA